MGDFGADPAGAKLLAPDRVAALGKVDDIPCERRRAWNEQLNAEYGNITLKEHYAALT